MLVLDDAIRSAIRDGGRNDVIRGLARGNGMRLMHEFALQLVHQGLTTLEEVQRVVPLEQLSAIACFSCLRELSPAFSYCPYCGEKRAIQEAGASASPVVELGAVNQ